MPAEVTIAIVGSGGDGVVTIGDLIAQAGARAGLHVVKTEAYGPQIRGGETSCIVRISSKPIFAQRDRVDVLVIFNWADFARFRSEIVPAPGVVILREENDAGWPDSPAVQLGLSPGELLDIPIPFLELARRATGSTASKNILALGILADLFRLPAEALRPAVEAKFSRKKEAVLEAALRGFDAGMSVGSELRSRDELSARGIDYTTAPAKLVMSGNEATALGALHAGCRFFAGYPITPSSEILHFLSEWLPRVGGSALQTEDELAAIGAVVGASFAGVKAMTATSGPGLSLMSETIGLAAIAEIPAVVINVQRGGPSTGIPTKSEQSDLWHALYSGHGDTPRVVLAPCDVEDCFHTTVEAFNIAEEYQIPVIVLSDQLIGQWRETLSADTLQHEVRDRLLPTAEELIEYRRYRDSGTGVSPMSIPGMKGGEYQTNGLEHDEDGRPSAMWVVHEAMNAKRFRKMWEIRTGHRFVRRYGPDHADVGIVCWGSSKGAVKEAVIAGNVEGRRISAFIPQLLYPFPKHEFEEFIRSVDQLLIIDVNYQGQFYKYLRTFVDLPSERTHVFKRSGGKPLAISEVAEHVERVLAHRNLAEEVTA